MSIREPYLLEQNSIFKTTGPTSKQLLPQLLKLVKNDKISNTIRRCTDEVFICSEFWVPFHKSGMQKYLHNSNVEFDVYPQPIFKKTEQRLSFVVRNTFSFLLFTVYTDKTALKKRIYHIPT